MKSRRIAALLLLALMVLIALAAIRRFHFTIITNKAIYLALHGKHHEAQGLLEYVVGQSPDNVRARRALADIELDLGNYTQAELLLVSLPVSVEVALGRAICYYETDREQLALESLQLAETAPHKTTDKLLQKLIAGSCNVLLGEAPTGEFLAIEVEDQPQARQRFFLSLQSRAAARTGKIALAQKLATKAISLGDRNSAARRLTVIACAALLDFPRARYYADTSPRGRFQWSDVLTDLKDLEEQTTTKTIAPRVTTAIEKRRVMLEGAKAWVLAQVAQDDKLASAALDALELSRRAMRDIPCEVRYLLLTATILELTGKPELAYSLLREWLKQRESYAVRLRLATLEGETPAAAAEGFEDSPNLVAKLTPNDFMTTGGILKGGMLAFYQAGRCASQFSIASDGEYYLVLTARGDRAFGLSPLVSIRIDGDKLDEAYIACEDWDIYAFPVYLTAGSHILELEYVNNSERLPTNEEDRNFYLANVMITRAEGSESGHDSPE